MNQTTRQHPLVGRRRVDWPRGHIALPRSKVGNELILGEAYDLGPSVFLTKQESVIAIVYVSKPAEFHGRQILSTKDMRLDCSRLDVSVIEVPPTPLPNGASR